MAMNEGLSARARLRALLGDLSEQHPDLSAGELATLVGRSLPEDDPDLVQEFLIEESRTMLAIVLRMENAQNRQAIYGAIGIDNPATKPLAQRSEKTRESIFERVTRWTEYVPSEQRSHRIMKMNRLQLADSGQYDGSRVFRFGTKMLWKKQLIDRLTNDQLLVEDVLTAEQVFALYEDVERKVQNGHFRLAIPTVGALSSRDPVSRQADGRNPARSKDDRGLAARKSRVR